MSLIDKVIEWIKSLGKPKPVAKDQSFKLVNPAWNNERIVYSGVLSSTKIFGIVHHLECRILTVKEAKEYWIKGQSQPTHWIKFFYTTKQGTHIYLIDKSFSFVSPGFKPNDAARWVMRRTAERIVSINQNSFFSFGETIPAVPTSEMFRKDRNGYSSQFWEAVITGEFNYGCQSSLGR